MANNWFNWPTSLKRFIRFDAARAEDVNDAFDDLSAGLDSLQVDVNRSLKLPTGTADQTLALTAGARANKVVAFDASGNITVSANDVDTTAANAAAAAASAGTASTQAGIATSQASAAAASASTANTKASEASTSATNAANSATSASGSASTATTQAGNASTSATNAASSASAASTSATNAASSATAASGSSTTATTKASEAATSATNAATSASNAAVSEANITLTERLFLGSKTADPTLDNDGNPLLAGTICYNSVADETRVFTGSAWKAAGSAVNGTSKRQSFTATAGQTTFTISGGYDAGFADVYLNGVKLVNGTDVDVSSGTQAVLALGAAVGDVLDFVGYGAFTLANMIEKPAVTGTSSQLLTAVGDGSSVWSDPPAGFTLAQAQATALSF